jgi:hypothetical protein
MDLSGYMDVFYFGIILLYGLIAIGWYRIRELIPISIISAIIVGIVNLLGINLGLFKYNKPFLDVFGIPLFRLLWAGIAGIVFIKYMKPNFSHNLLILIYSTALVQMLTYVSELAGEFQRLGSYNYYYNTVLDFSALAAILLLSESLYKYKIYNMS